MFLIISIIVTAVGAISALVAGGLFYKLNSSKVLWEYDALNRIVTFNSALSMYYSDHGKQYPIRTTPVPVSELTELYDTYIVASTARPASGELSYQGDSTTYRFIFLCQDGLPLFRENHEYIWDAATGKATHNWSEPAAATPPH